MYHHSGQLTAAQAYSVLTPLKWKVWFAWHPVKVIVYETVTRIHDEITISHHLEWRWLVTVSRRKIFKYRGAAYYQYAPAHKAVTQ